MTIVYFAAGCFWHVEEVFAALPGVQQVRVGYMGGTVIDPSYEQVCRGDTQHAEVVEVTYEEELLDFHALLQTFWSEHDATTANRQGPDIGTQYRSAIFCTTETQLNQALESKQALQAQTHPGIISTEISRAPIFYAAEAYHQHYLAKQRARY